ncbi:hypothetical protein STANM309S_00790 [Streptomyces tanashiensis]
MAVDLDGGGVRSRPSCGRKRLTPKGRAVSPRTRLISWYRPPAVLYPAGEEAERPGPRRRLRRARDRRRHPPWGPARSETERDRSARWWTYGRRAVSGPNTGKGRRRSAPSPVRTDCADPGATAGRAPLPPLNASLSRRTAPAAPAGTGRIEPSSPRSLASSRRSRSCSASSLLGVVTSTCTIRSPQPLPRRCVTPRPCSGIDWPDCVPGRMSISSTPSRVCSGTLVPSAPAVIGMVTVQCRSSPRRWKTSCGVSWISTYRSPAGPPPGPTSPSPASWMRVPLSTPAGI